MDKVDTATRSMIMSKVRSTGNRTTEWRLRAVLVRCGIRGWRLGTASGLPGKPDFVFPCLRTALFVDGCFWHGCKICGRKRKMPLANAAFWRLKIRTNWLRDRRQGRALRRLGWKVLRVWEHQLAKDKPKVVEKIRKIVGKKGRQS